MDRTLNSYLEGMGKGMKQVLDTPSQAGMKNMAMWKRLAQR